MTKAREIKYPKGNIELKEYPDGDWSKTHYNQYGDPIKYEDKERFFLLQNIHTMKMVKN